MSDTDLLVAVLRDGPRDEVLAVLGALTDLDRRAIGPRARGWLTFGAGTDEGVPPEHAALAVVATATGHRQAMVATRSWLREDELVDDAVTLLGQRAPAWLANLVDALVGDGGTTSWRLARGIVRAGLVAPPERPEYYAGTVRGVGNLHDRRPLADVLAADPGLVGEHLLVMLSVERVGRALATHDGYWERPWPHEPDRLPYPAGTWRVALVALARDGRLDRARLLDAALAAPLRDWAPADVGWYVTLHDELAPTPDEVVARQATYARLLTVEHGPSVKTAQRELRRLVGDPRFDPALVVEASRATLVRTDKGTVAAQLRLLDAIAAAHPGSAVADVVRVAGEHPREDVRAQAHALLAVLGVPAPAATPVHALVVPAPAARPVADPVPPVASPDELAELLATLLTDVDAIGMERAIDGVLRFADEPPASAQLLDRVRAEFDEGGSRTWNGDPRSAPAALARAWLTARTARERGDWSVVLGRVLHPWAAAGPDTFVGAIARRLSAVVWAVRCGGHASVALPRADGTIDADELGRRLADLGGRRPPSELELAVALLRVPAEQRAAVAIPAALRTAALDRVVAAGPPQWERGVVTYGPFPWRPAAHLAVFRDPAALDAGALGGILPRRNPGPTAGDESVYGEHNPRFEQTLALGATLLPHEPDVLAAHAHPYLHADLTAARAVAVPVLDALARARTANGDPASSALVLGLAAKDARARTAAQDALLDLARCALLDGASLGRQAALHLRDDLVVGARVVDGLAQVARASDAAVRPVLDALAQVLPELPGRRDAAPFVELAADLAARTGARPALPDELRALAAGSSTSALARAARRLA